MMMFSGPKDSDFGYIIEPIDNFRYAEKAMLYSQGA